MSQNIALTISLGGTQKAVSNIEQLESAIAEAKNQLKGLEIGSKAFTKLAADVKVADQRLKDLNKSIEGKDLEARIGDFGKLGGAIGASFASASAAIQLFGVESEDSLKAVTQAQAALTLALGAKAAAESAYVIKQYASIAASKIQIAVTNNLASATKGLFDIIKANPYTAVITVIAGLVAIMIDLNAETETYTETTENLIDLQNKAIGSTVAETTKLKILQQAVTDTNKTTEERLAAYRELQKIVPTLNGYTLDQAINEGILTREIQTQITLIEERARARALEGKITELYAQQLDLVIEAQRLFAQTTGVVTKAEAEAALQREGQVGQLGVIAGQYQTVTKQIRDLTGQNSLYQSALTNVLNLEAYQTEQLEKQKRAAQALLKLEQEREKQKQKAAADRAKQLLLEGQITQAELDQLFRLEEFIDSEPEVIKNLKEKIATQERWIGTLNRERTAGEKRDEVIIANRQEQDLAYESLKQFTDQWEKLFDRLQSGQVSLEDIPMEMENIRLSTGLTKEALEGLVNQDTLDNLDRFKTNALAVSRAFAEIENQGFPVNKMLRDFFNQQKILNDEFATAEEKGVAGANAILLRASAYEEYLKKLGGRTNLTEQEINNAQTTFDSWVKTITDGSVEISKFTNGVVSTNKEVKALNAEIASNENAVKKAFNADQIKEFIAGLQQGVEQIQMVLGALQQTVSAYYNQQFDLLEKRNNRIKEGIIGDSEEAAKKRIEAEKSYQAERKRLEKEAAKTQLRISFAQSLANTAEAITRAFAQTGIGGIIAGSLVAAASGAQTVIIAQQLAAIDSYKRGGIMRRQGGGFVTGPAHEFGGVKFQGGGVELEGNEAVINRVSTINYMGLLDQINQAGGGRPISSLANESRLIEAIAKQRNTPIRAYVVESDITAKQETARRLERLSQF